MHAKETKSRTYMQWSAEPAEASMEPKDQTSNSIVDDQTRREEKTDGIGLFLDERSAAAAREAGGLP
jgi:hypothetical protein